MTAFYVKYLKISIFDLSELLKKLMVSPFTKSNAKPFFVHEDFFQVMIFELNLHKNYSMAKIFIDD